MLLTLWGCAVLFTIAIDQTMTWRRLSGRFGDGARAEVQCSIDKYGGPVWYFTLTILFADTVLFPLVLAGCAHGYLREKRIRTRQDTP